MDEESKPPHPDQKSRVALPFQDSDQIQTKQSKQQSSGERNRHNSARRLVTAKRKQQQRPDEETP